MPSPLTTPVADGYRMPAEWEEHMRTWMLWPYRPDVWRENARPAQEAFAHVAAVISRFEPVTVIALPALADKARRLLPPAVVWQIFLFNLGIKFAVTLVSLPLIYVTRDPEEWEDQ